MTNNTCKSCGKAKKTESGKLEDYLELCSCELKAEQDHTITICEGCGKRIEARKTGSLTQYVFRYDNCSCEKPTPKTHSLKSNFEQKPFAGFEEDDEELDLPSSSFPRDRFKPIRKLGSGATGSVYLAFDRFLRKKVAVKTLHSLESDQLILFQNEAKATSKLSHPNIISILDFGCTEEGTPFMVLEYFHGDSLENYLKKHNHMEWNEFKKILKGFCNALGYAHNQGLYHRDIKPSNILVSDLESNSPRVKLIDFGVAKLIDFFQTTEFQGRTLAGTPEYMSPDVANGHAYSSKSDIYSLGCVAFECLSGVKPFKSESALQVIALHAKKSAPKLKDVSEFDIPDVAEHIVSKCLSKEPEERPSIDEILESLVTESSPVAFEEPIEKVEQRKRVSATPILVVLITATVFLVGIVIAQITSDTGRPVKPKSVVEEADTSDAEKLFEGYTSVLWDGGITWHKKFFATDKDLLKLNSSNEMEYISLYKERHFTDAGFKHLLKLKIKGVGLAGTETDVSRIKLITKINPGIDALLLGNCRNIQGDNLRILSDLKQLRILDISQIDLGANGLKHISKIKSLELLKIEALKGSIDGIRYLKQLPKLRLLSVNYNKLNRKDWREIAQIKSLEILSANSSNLDDASAKLLEKLSLKKLDISYNYISSKTLLEIFGENKSLEVLIIGKNQFSPPVVDRFKTKLPDCRLIMEQSEIYGTENKLFMTDDSLVAENM